MKMREEAGTWLVIGLVACLVLGLAYLAWSRYASRLEEAKRRTAESLEQSRQLGEPIRQYSQDFNNAYPWAIRSDDEAEIGWSALRVLFPKYIESGGQFVTPSATDSEEAAGEEPERASTESTTSD
jgi:hypothetical protein